MITTLYCVHGWSFDRHFWDGLRPHLPDLTFICADRGYFGAPSFPPLPQTPYLAVGHSAGVLTLLGHSLPGCRGIVSINGFACFVDSPDNPEGIPARALERMRTKVLRAPDAVLADFRTLCGTPDPWPITPQAERLATGLTELLNCDFRENARKLGSDFHWLAGAADPFAVARQPLSPSGECIEGGHLLPLQQPEHCAAFLRRKLDACS